MALRASSPVLVGRTAELASLHEALGTATSGRATTVLVEGEAGIGKSRLLGDFSDQARERGAVVLRGGCVRLGRDDGLPFAPVVEALRVLLRERGPAPIRALLDESMTELVSLVPELAQGSAVVARPDQRPDWAQTRLFESVLVLLSGLSAEGPTLFVVEDLHWADRSTLDLLTFLALNLRDERVVLVGSYRSDELHRRHPLRAWAAELQRLPVVRISLTRLARDELRSQIEGITGRAAESTMVEAIDVRSGGNPFLVEELLAVSQGPGDLPASLREVLLARVSALSAQAQWLLPIASVAGPVVDHDLLLAVAGTAEPALASSLREAVTAHVLVPSSDDDRVLYTFRHALLQEAAYDDILPRERRRLHSAYARALLASDVPPGAAGASHLAALAHHAEAAHELPRALSAWLRAARAAFDVHAAAESSHAYWRCLELWDAVAADDLPEGEALVDVLYEASYALAGTGDIERAVEVARRAVELEEDRDPEREAELLVRLGRTQWLFGDLVTATATLERAVTLVDTRSPSHIAARAVGGLASVLMLRGANRRAIETGRRALELAEAVGSPAARSHALNTLGAALADSGDCEGGVALAQQGLQLAVELQDAEEIHRAYANLSTALEVCGRCAEAAEVALEGVAWARRRGMWRLQGAFLEGNAASALFHDGRWAQAAALLDTPHEPLVTGVATLNHAVTAGPLYLRTGRRDEARAILEDSRARLSALRDAQFTGPIYAASAELALTEDRPEAVAELIDEAWALMSDTDDVHYRAELLRLAVVACAQEALAARAARDHARVRAAHTEAERRLEALRDLLAEDASTDSFAHRKAEAELADAEAFAAAMRGEPAAAGWRAAAARWEALHLPYRTASCLARVAEALLASGDRAGGSEALRGAHESSVAIGATVLQQECERLALLARVDLSVGGPGPGDDGGSNRADDATPNAFDLTDRELQILPLLAGGMTNRQIGSTLFISESTVGVHVSRIIGKMGVASRVEAAAMAVRTGLAD